MNILVTGATGFLGTHLTRKLRAQGHTVHLSNTKEANLSRIENLHIFNSIKWDYCLTHQGEQWEDNQLLNTNMLIYWKNYQPQAKMVAMGTSCSYPVTLPMSEENYLAGEPGQDLLTYAMTKRMLLVGLRAFQQQHGLKWLCFIPSTLYGPGFQQHDNHFIFDLVRKIYNGKYYNKPVELWGDGQQRRELIYVEDAVDAMLNLLGQENQIFNLGSSNDLSIQYYAQKISEYLDYDPEKIYYNIEKYVGVRKRSLEVAKVRKLLPEYCNTPLEVGIKNIVDFYHHTYGGK